MTRNRLLLHCFFLFLSTASWGGDLTPAQIESKLSTYQNLRAFRTEFEQTKRLKEVGVTLHSQGELTVIRPAKIIWRIKKPSSLVLTLDGNQVDIVQGEGADQRKQHWALESGASDKDLQGIHDLSAWLRLDAKAIALSFRLIEEKPGEFLCLPKREGAKTPFRALHMHLGKKGHLERLVLEERSGDELVISFSAPHLLP